jgi:hypothetical protein
VSEEVKILLDRVKLPGKSHEASLAYDSLMENFITALSSDSAASQ